MYWMIFVFILALPLVKALADRIRAMPAPGPGVDLELRRELDQVNAQLQESNERLRAMETRLDFYEQLIEERHPTALPPAADTATPKIIT